MEDEYKNENEKLKDEAEIMKNLEFIDVLNRTEFESSPELTPQFAAFSTEFQKGFKKYLTEKFHAKNIKINRGHFYEYGFFTLPNGQIIYFSLGDVRWDKNMFMRTAENYKDFKGGPNYWINLDSKEAFDRSVSNFLRQETRRLKA